MVCTEGVRSPPAGVPFLQEGRVGRRPPAPPRGCFCRVADRARPRLRLLGQGTWGLCCGGRARGSGGGVAVGCGTTGRPGFCDGRYEASRPDAVEAGCTLCLWIPPEGRHRERTQPLLSLPAFRGHCLSRLKREAPQSGGSSLDSPAQGAYRQADSTCRGQFYLVPP